MNDKVKHIIAGIIIGVVFAVLIKIFWIRDLMILSAGIALLAGIAKEIIWDKWLRKQKNRFCKNKFFSTSSFNINNTRGMRIKYIIEHGLLNL